MMSFPLPEKKPMQLKNNHCAAGGGGGSQSSCSITSINGRFFDFRAASPGSFNFRSPLKTAAADDDAVLAEEEEEEEEEPVFFLSFLDEDDDEAFGDDFFEEEEEEEEEDSLLESKSLSLVNSLSLSSGLGDESASESLDQSASSSCCSVMPTFISM